MNIYESLGLTPSINASGPVTRLGGARMPQRVIESWCAAAVDTVPLELLQAAASQRIARASGAEAGLVTAGAAAALTLGAAAIMTGYDVARMEKLPHAADFPCEFVVAREHRSGYDHAVRAAGAKLVEVGFNEMVAGAGVRRTEAWEYAAAFGPRTAGVLYVDLVDGRPRLDELVEVAHARGVPVLVDAAGRLAVRQRLRAIPAAGADLACFSGGKALRGPQASGILCGRRDLVGAAALQMLDMDDHPELWEPPEELIDRNQLDGMPRHGIGRALKVAKEEIVALLSALELFESDGPDAGGDDERRRLEMIAAAIQSDLASSRLVERASEMEHVRSLEISIDEARLGRTAFDLCRSLRRGTPPIYVGHAELAAGMLVIHPACLDDGGAAEIARRLNEELLASVTPPAAAPRKRKPR